ncbi:pentatricopeptide repeat-containing protein At1g69290-like [Vigna radiata var. radiata]|uniref:Pentatricopeptide repeat-containing protein At1g69290-like n=1 Tax=Vigna radiata var. radiata TaxID=3916 RepID=A0A1S3VN09_VIGRR|nr:pentatricopeptide repeat-containing protein At1g69290-like [Vigna radiata var. radiata]
MEKNPLLLQHDTLHHMLLSIKGSNTAALAFSLVRSMLGFRLFEENCRAALEERVEFMNPDVGACNAALEGCCCELKFVSDAKRVMGTMSSLGVRPDESNFGFLGYLYALKGLEEKIKELDVLMGGFGCLNKKGFYCNLIKGYTKSGNLASVEATIVRLLNDGCGKDWGFGVETFCEVIKVYFQKGNIKGLANLIVEAQKIEGSNIAVDRSIGHGIVNACVTIGLSDKAHSILDEMNVQGLLSVLGSIYLS